VNRPASVPFQLLAALLLAPLAALPAAEAPQKSLPLPGHVFSVAGHPAFVILPSMAGSHAPIPWVSYAPTLPGLPGNEEKWMFERFNLAVAGIDVGESYDSPAGGALYSAFHEQLTGRYRLAPKPVLLGRSRGGLMALSWAAANPEKVAGCLRLGFVPGQILAGIFGESRLAVLAAKVIRSTLILGPRRALVDVHADAGEVVVVAADLAGFRPAGARPGVG